MIRGLLRKAFRPLGKRKTAKLAEKLDRAVVKEADKHTGGLASKVDEAL